MLMSRFNRAATLNMRPRVQKRLTLVGVLITVAIIVATHLIIEMQRSAALAAFQTATTNLCGGMSRQTTRPIAKDDETLREVRDSLTLPPGRTVDSMVLAMRSVSMSSHLRELGAGLPGVTSLVLYTADGRMASASGRSSPAMNISDRDFFRHFRLRNDQGLFVGAPVEDPRTGEWAAPMARRIAAPDGTFVGVIVADLSLTDLQEFYRVAMPPGRMVHLARPDGMILVAYPRGDSAFGKRIPAGLPWYTTFAKGGGTYIGSSYFSVAPVLASVHVLPGLPLVLEASVTDTDALQDWNRQKWWVALGGFLSILGTIALLRLFANQYHRLEQSELSLAAKNAQLEIVYRQLDATLANVPQGVCLFDEDRRLLVFNEKYCELYGIPADAIRPGMTKEDINQLRVAAGSFSDETLKEYVASVDRLIDAGTPHDSTIQLANGRIISGHYQPLDGHGWVVTHEDITERREAEAEISFLAHHDVLTGLANRVLFYDQLGKALGQTKRGETFAILFLDLDRFKAVNDEFGHPIGDSLLCAVADRLREAVRDGDTIARLGGDEFAILQVGVSDLNQTTALARRIVDRIGEPFELDGIHVGVGVSIGIAMIPGDGSTAEQLMKNADLALYRSKQEGRGTWRFFQPAMDTLAQSRRVLEADLREALPLGQFELYFQPIVASRGSRVTGFEALLRWHHPTRGLVQPDAFIPVAEEIGLIGEIGAWVLQQACLSATTWPAHLRVAVNLSNRQFNDRDLVATVANALGLSGLAPRRLELEITESVPLKSDQATLSMLRDLRALGVRIALDDFGTGYSSLSYLRSFPFDTIKIDRSFVADIETRDQSIGIIRGLISLATNLNISVTAEGVETGEQFELLAEAGCDEIQGYFISKPLPSDHIPALIDRLDRAAKESNRRAYPGILAAGARSGGNTLRVLVDALSVIEPYPSDY